MVPEFILSLSFFLGLERMQKSFLKEWEPGEDHFYYFIIYPTYLPFMTASDTISTISRGRNIWFIEEPAYSSYDYNYYVGMSQLPGLYDGSDGPISDNPKW